MMGMKIPPDLNQYITMSKMWATAYPQLGPPQMKFTDGIPPSLNRGAPMTFLSLPNLAIQHEFFQPPACNLFH